ncbi:MAG TPA: tetratricopeptide repeat protein [Candidatus Methylomirabilis sp.]|nr:tetratricopeptide repeat protein [Candidatus Methylomirabilis sp.]
MRFPQEPEGRRAAEPGGKPGGWAWRSLRLSWAFGLLAAVLGQATGWAAETPLTPGIRILVVETEAQARSAVAAYNGGVPFEQLVQERSIRPDARGGGYLGRVDPATLAPEARAALAKTRRGRLSQIFRTEGGFAVIQVVTEREEQELEARARQGPEARGLLRRGTELGKHGDLEGGVSLLRRAIDLDPSLADAHFNLAIAYGKLGRPDAAIAAMREAVRLQPDDAEAHLRLGGWLFERGLLAEACEAYERAATLQMDSLEAWLRLAQSYEAAGRARAAVAAYRRVLGLLGRDSTALVMALYRVAMQAGDGPAAVEAARKLRAVQPGHEGLLNLGDAFLLNGEPEAAVREFQMASALAPSSVKAHVGLAAAYARLGRAEAAAESYQRAIRLNPKNPELYGHLARLYEGMARLDLGIVALRDGLSAASGSSPALLVALAEQLASLYEKAGMSREAARERQRLQGTSEGRGVVTDPPLPPGGTPKENSVQESTPQGSNERTPLSETSGTPTPESGQDRVKSRQDPAARARSQSGAPTEKADSPAPIETDGAAVIDWLLKRPSTGKK